MVPADEALGRRAALDRAFDVGVVELGRGAAGGAQQELPRMRMAGTGAADEGVERRQPVHQPLGEQELERAVDGGRRRGVPFARQHLQDGVGAERTMALPDDFQHPPAHRGEPHPALAANRYRILQRGRHAIAVIVLVGKQPAIPFLHAVHGTGPPVTTGPVARPGGQPTPPRCPGRDVWRCAASARLGCGCRLTRIVIILQ